MRVRHPKRRRMTGFMYVTPKRWVLHWSTRGDGNQVIGWQDVTSWGVDSAAEGGPLLCVGCGDSPVVVQMAVSSDATAAEISAFMTRFARFAPRPAQAPSGDGVHGEFRVRTDFPIRKQHLSVAQRTQRIAVTVLGIVMVVGGLVISPLPGPWSLPIVIGGLALLASEYDWAQDLLTWVKDKSKQARQRLRARRSASE